VQESTLSTKKESVSKRDVFVTVRHLTEHIKAQTKLGQFELVAHSSGEPKRQDNISRNGEGTSSHKIAKLLEMAKRLYRLIENLRKNQETKKKIYEETSKNLKYRFDYLRACVATAEVFAYFDKNDYVRAIVGEEGPSIYGGLLAGFHPPREQRDLSRQKIWFLIYYGYGLYRQHRYQEALRVLDACEKFVEVLRDEKAFPCYFTRAKLLYCRGQVLRQLSRLDSARRCYKDAIQLIYKRLERVKNMHSLHKYEHKQIVQEEIRANYEIAKCLALGVGWIEYTQGFLHEARTNVLTALAILSPIPDVIHKAYTQLLYGCIQRAAAGFNRSELQKAIDTVEEPYRKFGEYDHATYRSRAAYELALAYLYRGRAEEMNSNVPKESYDKAESYIDEVNGFSVRAGDSRWMCNALILRSRLQRYRHNIDEAKALAQEALNRAISTEQRPQIIEAYIARGEAHTEAGNSSPESRAQAVQDFEHALEFVDRNPKSYGICHLHLSNAYIKQKDAGRAREHFQKWESVKRQVQQQIVQDIGKKVSQELVEASKAWLLIRTEDTLEFSHHEQRVRQFLINQATARHKGNVAKIAKSLGIKRATYYNWLKSLRSGAK